jgi:hypothetical protein
MAKQSKNKRELKVRVNRAMHREVKSFEAKSLFSFLDSYSASSKKYNSLDIKVDSNLVKAK